MLVKPGKIKMKHPFIFFDSQSCDYDADNIRSRPWFPCTWDAQLLFYASPVTATKCRWNKLDITRHLQMEVSRAWRKSPLLTRGVEKSNLLHRHYILSLLVCNGQVALDRFYQRVNMCIVSGEFQVDLKKKKSITKTTTCQWLLQLSARAPVSKSNPVLQFFLLLQTLLKRIDTE